MTETFTDFLRDRAAKYNAKRADRDAVVAEWREALAQLYDRLRRCLSNADPDGILTVTEGQRKINEQGLGVYTVPSLNIDGLGEWVGIVPKARYTVGTVTPPQKSTPERAAGRVDITDEVRRYILYRVSGGGGDTWLIDDTNGNVKPLDDATFLDALKSYLR